MPGPDNSAHFGQRKPLSQVRVQWSRQPKFAVADLASALVVSAVSLPIAQCT